MLVVVIRSLGRFWTVKLLLASDHVLVTNPLFRWVRHPNYFLICSLSSSASPSFCTPSKRS